MSEVLSFASLRPDDLFDTQIGMNRLGAGMSAAPLMAAAPVAAGVTSLTCQKLTPSPLFQLSLDRTRASMSLVLLKFQQ